MSFAEDLIRVEKKVDVLMERLGLLYQLLTKSSVLPVESPLHQTLQICPLCKQMVTFKNTGHEVERKCGCRLPTGSI